MVFSPPGIAIPRALTRQDIEALRVPDSPCSAATPPSSPPPEPTLTPPSSAESDSEPEQRPKPPLFLVEFEPEPEPTLQVPVDRAVYEGVGTGPAPLTGQAWRYRLCFRDKFMVAMRAAKRGI